MTSRANASTLQRFSGLMLLELLIVVGIVALLMVLVAPAFTPIKGRTEVTGAAYTIKGVLDTARTYARANIRHTARQLPFLAAAPVHQRSRSTVML